MDESTADRVLERLDQLGEISVQGFEILVQQAIIEGIVSITWAVIWFALAGALAYAAKRTYTGDLFPQMYETRYSNNDRHKAWGVSYGIASSLLFLLGLTMTNIGIKYLINPEFYAIRFILRQTS